MNYVLLTSLSLFSESLLMNYVLLTSLFVICIDPYWIIHLPFLSGQFLLLCMDVNDTISTLYNIG
jgi:hypothetical protein